VIVAFGWVLLLAAAQLSHFLVSFSGSEAIGNSSFNVNTIAQCTILSGFGIAIICTLQTGFCALNRFFDAVLVRSGKSQVEMPRDLQSERRLPGSVTAGIQQVKQTDLGYEKSSQAKLAANRLTQAALKRQTGIKKIVERGWVKDKAYVLFADGAVEVETLLGLRRFSSLQEAHDFIS
jgi:hypothetical protein